MLGESSDGKSEVKVEPFASSDCISVFFKAKTSNSQLLNRLSPSVYPWLPSYLRYRALASNWKSKTLSSFAENSWSCFPYFIILTNSSFIEC